MGLNFDDINDCGIQCRDDVVKTFKELKHISEHDPTKLKIVRIKNRLKQGTNDILINVKFNNAVIC